MFFLTPLVGVLMLLTAPPGVSSAQDRPASPWSAATDITMVANERDSLAGLSRLAVRVVVPEGVSAQLAAEPLSSTVTFRLEQAGLVVTPTRAIEEPLLTVTLRQIAVRGGLGEAPQTAYRIDVDLLQLVRLADTDRGRARLMMASTWHAGTFGTAAPAGADQEIATRIAEVVDTFIGDYRMVNPRTTNTVPAPVPAPAPAPAEAPTPAPTP